MNSRIDKILQPAKKIYNSAFSLARFPEKHRQQNHRIWVLEQSVKVCQQQIDASRHQIDVLSGHLPRILNEITSFNHLSRELAGKNSELDEALSRLTDQVNAIRQELLRLEKLG